MGASTARIENYMRKTGISRQLEKRYDMDTRECEAIYESCQGDIAGVMYLAFRFGRAKGYRAAKAEALDEAKR